MVVSGPLLRCPELSRAELIGAFEANPQRLVDLLEGLSDEDLRAEVIAGKWSIKTIAMHVVETEIMAAARFRQAISQSERKFAFWDQNVWATELGYREADMREVEVALALYAGLRAATGLLLRRMPDAVWQRAGEHPKRGEMTVRELLEHHTVHSERHLVQIQERRALLGNAKELPRILPVSSLG